MMITFVHLWTKGKVCSNTRHGYNPILIFNIYWLNYDSHLGILVSSKSCFMMPHKSHTVITNWRFFHQQVGLRNPLISGEMSSSLNKSSSHHDYLLKDILPCSLLSSVIRKKLLGVLFFNSYVAQQCVYYI